MFSLIDDVCFRDCIGPSGAPKEGASPPSPQRTDLFPCDLGSSAANKYTRTYLKHFMIQRRDRDSFFSEIRSSANHILLQPQQQRWRQALSLSINAVASHTHLSPLLSIFTPVYLLSNLKTLFCHADCKYLSVYVCLPHNVINK